MGYQYFMAYTPGINWIDIPGSWYCSLRPRRRPAANARSGAALGTAAAQVIAESFEKCDWSRFNRLEFLGIYL